MKKIFLALVAMAAIMMVGCKPNNTPDAPKFKFFDMDSVVKNDFAVAKQVAVDRGIDGCYLVDVTFVVDKHISTAKVEDMFIDTIMTKFELGKDSTLTMTHIYKNNVQVEELDVIIPDMTTGNNFKPEDIKVQWYDAIRVIQENFPEFYGRSANINRVIYPEIENRLTYHFTQNNFVDAATGEYIDITPYLEFYITHQTDTSARVAVKADSTIYYAYYQYNNKEFKNMQGKEKKEYIMNDFQEALDKLGKAAFMQEKELVHHGVYVKDYVDLDPSSSYCAAAVQINLADTTLGRLYLENFETLDPPTFRWNPYTTIGDTAFWFQPANKTQPYFALLIDSAQMVQDYPAGITPEEVLDEVAALAGKQISKDFRTGDFYANYTGWTTDQRFYFVAAIYNNEGKRRSTIYHAPGNCLKKEWWK